jgi:hypothetical protein
VPWLDNPAPLNLQRGHEYAAYIINALEGASRSSSTATWPTGADHQPAAKCLRGSPVWTSRRALEPVGVGALPPQCAILTNLSSQIEEMAVAGSAHRQQAADLSGDCQRSAQRGCALARRDRYTCITSMELHFPA